MLARRGTSATTAIVRGRCPLASQILAIQLILIGFSTKQWHPRRPVSRFYRVCHPTPCPCSQHAPLLAQHPICPPLLFARPKLFSVPSPSYSFLSQASLGQNDSFPLIPTSCPSFSLVLFVSFLAFPQRSQPEPFVTDGAAVQRSTLCLAIRHEWSSANAHLLSWGQSRLGFLVVEAPGHQCLRRHAGVEVGLRACRPVRHLVQVHHVWQ